MNNGAPACDDVKIHARFKLAALWTSVMFCYIYNDYFLMWKPGSLGAMLEGRMGPLGTVTQGVLLGASISVLVPGLMIFLSLVLTPTITRWLNIVLGLAYTLIIVATIPGAWAFYIVYDVVEGILTLLIVWYAWKWPRRAVA